jgi:hypothetical protein
MGREPDGKRKHVCFCLAGLIFIVLSGCATVGEKRRPNEIRQWLTRGAELFARGDYRGSLRENQRVLDRVGGELPGDEALFGLGLIYAHVGNPDKDYGKAADFFRKVARDFPGSPLAAQAKVWVGLLEENGRLFQSQEKSIRENDRLSQENQKLKQVIEKSKQVDIEIEQKKRERER